MKIIDASLDTALHEMMLELEGASSRRVYIFISDDDIGCVRTVFPTCHYEVLPTALKSGQRSKSVFLKSKSTPSMR